MNIYILLILTNIVLIVANPGSGCDTIPCVNYKTKHDCVNTALCCCFWCNDTNVCNYYSNSDCATGSKQYNCNMKPTYIALIIVAGIVGLILLIIIIKIAIKYYRKRHYQIIN